MCAIVCVSTCFDAHIEEKRGRDPRRNFRWATYSRVCKRRPMYLCVCPCFDIIRAYAHKYRFSGMYLYSTYAPASFRVECLASSYIAWWHRLAALACIIQEVGTVSLTFSLSSRENVQHPLTCVTYNDITLFCDAMINWVYLRTCTLI